MFTYSCWHSYVYVTDLHQQSSWITCKQHCLKLVCTIINESLYSCKIWPVPQHASVTWIININHIQVFSDLRIPGFTNFTSRQAVLLCPCVHAFRQTDSNFRYAVSCHADTVESDCTVMLRNISNLLTPLNSLCRQNERIIHMPITYATICAKALALFKSLKGKKMRWLWRNFFWFDRYKKKKSWLA
jgi:hypothetical protein